MARPLLSYVDSRDALDLFPVEAPRVHPPALRDRPMDEDALAWFEEARVQAELAAEEDQRQPPSEGAEWTHLSMPALAGSIAFAGALLGAILWMAGDGDVSGRAAETAAPRAGRSTSSSAGPRPSTSVFASPTRLYRPHVEPAKPERVEAAAPSARPKPREEVVLTKSRAPAPLLRDVEATSGKSPAAPPRLATLPAVPTESSLDFTVPVGEVIAAPTAPSAVVTPAAPVRRAPGSPPVAAPVSPVVRVTSDEDSVRAVLGQYRTAYSELDPYAARAVWPTVDMRALTRAFDQLANQRLEFRECTVALSDTSARADCSGSASFKPKLGGRSSRTEARQWQFDLHKGPDGWTIDAVHSR